MKKDEKIRLYAIIGLNTTAGTLGIVTLADPAGIFPLVTMNGNLFTDRVIDLVRHHTPETWSDICIYTFESVDQTTVRE